MIMKKPGMKRKKVVLRKKACPFTKAGDAKEGRIEPHDIHYTDVALLKRFIGETGSILPTRVTGVAPKYQKALSLAIKRARMVALLPFVEKFI